MTQQLDFPDFSHLKKHDVKEKIVDFEFYELEGTPVLQVVFAGEGNPGYFNAIAGNAHKNSRALRSRKGSVTARAFKKNREEDLELFPKYVVKGWSVPPEDSQRQPVAFSEAACSAFLNALPIHILDRFRNFASDPESFVEDDEEPPMSAEDAAELGNS